MTLTILLCIIISQVSLFRIKRYLLDSDVVLHPTLYKPVKFNWKRNGGSKVFKLRLPSAVAISDFRNLQDWPVLSVDYGTKFIGLSFHYGDYSKCLEGITHDGDVDATCRYIQGIINDLSSKFPILDRVLILIGISIAHERVTDGKLLFQTLYNLDFGVKLSKFIASKRCVDDLESRVDLGDVAHLLTNQCLFCNLGLSKLHGESLSQELACSRPGNTSCPEIYEIVKSTIPCSLVAGITEDFSTYQSHGPGRRDSLASCNIFENFKHLKGSGIAILPSEQSIFRSHKKEDSLPVYRGLCKFLHNE